MVSITFVLSAVTKCVTKNEANSAVGWKCICTFGWGNAYKSGMKDEFILLVIFVPLMLSFLPDYAPYVDAGFTALKAVPEYFWYVVAAVVIDTFGFRSIVCYLSFKWKEIRVDILETLAISIGTGWRSLFIGIRLLAVWEMLWRIRDVSMAANQRKILALYRKGFKLSGMEHRT
ncbi:hypothetical protein GMA8713_00999 [Grimontia marina]|uniref:Uncharacterized protein n=1 Tax=Grimontia marina TaxID=646534 RepID=A0A128EY29_9GAMM|nr:hypothetical protein GMA8713_00999 [Grimontia marina]